MKKKKWALCIFAVILVSCATKTLYVPVMQPAEINLRGYSNVAILGIRGSSMGDRVTTSVKEAIISSKHLQVVEREKIDNVLFERGFDPSSASQLSNLVAADLLLTGKVLQEDYDENMDSKKKTCTKYDQAGKPHNYECTEYTRKGSYRFEATMDLVDVKNGSVIFTKRHFCKRTKETTATKETYSDPDPPEIDKNALADSCVTEVSEVFVKAILPHMETMSADFKKDKNLPQLEMGIKYAQAGQWEDALAQFEAAVAQASSTSGLKGETKARAHWDYGLALMFNYRFEEARKQFKLAFDASGGNQSYLAEMGRCNKLEADYKKLQEQGVVSSGEAPATAPVQ